jgi:16S rRNA (adenine1518-N6/adenine1519-N6)-dimethyltransferase
MVQRRLPAMTLRKQTSGVQSVRPRKRWGQCFLQDRNIVRKILALAELRADDTVMEIGAGTGVMTALIAEKVKHVLAVEIDPLLVNLLRDRLGNTKNIEIIHGDVLTFDLAGAVKDFLAAKLKVIGNIPYNISTPILFHLLAYRDKISTAILMVQKEVAQRIAAGPGTKDYGIPSVLTAVYARAVSAFTVPPGCFYPEPKVTSAVVRIDFRSEPLGVIEDENLFREVVRLAFANRRKTLMNNLRHSSPLGCSEKDLQGLFEAEGLELRIRGEALMPEQLISLSNRLKSCFLK